MEPDKKRGETPRSVADALNVVTSVDPVPDVTMEVSADESAAKASAEISKETPRIGEVQSDRKESPFKQKKVFIPLLVLAVALLAGGLFAIFRGGPDAQGEQQLSGLLGVSVTVLDGKASYSSDGELWEDLRIRTILSEGDHVRTDTGSRVVLTLDDGSAVRLDESTSVQLASLDAADIQLTQRSGSVYSRVVPSDRNFTVEVDDNTYTALGTAFQTTNTADEKGVRVLQSGVKFGDITVAEGKQYYTVHSDHQYVEKLTDISIDELKTNGFLLWNLEQDEKDSLFRGKLGYWEKVKNQPQPVETAPAGAKIELSAASSNKGAVLTWTVTGVTAPDGFKIVRSSSSVMPAFGKDESQHASSPSARSFTWSGSKSGTFHYRVCIYRASDSSCSVYSNTVTLETAAVAPEAVAPGAVNLSISEDMINWTFAGTAPHGFKVLVSSSENPVYPKDAEYFGNAPYMLKSRPSGTYYVRVCKYTASDEISGGCTDYSNQVIWIVP